PEPKMGINALTPSTNGFLYANNPTAATAPHTGIIDYSGYTNTDVPGIVAAGTSVTYRPDPPLIKTSFNSVTATFHTGETGTNKTFIDYLRAAPKIERIFPETSGGTSTSVQFTVLFNKEVTGVDVSDFRVQGTHTATGKISAISGSGKI